MRKRLACLLALSALVFVTPAFSQTGPAQNVTGVVVSSTNDSLVIRTDDGTERTFKVDAQSTLPSSLASGSRVTVNFHRMDGGVDHAARVTIATAGDTTPRTETMPADPAGTATGELPATAGPVPHLVLFGLGALAAGLGLRRSARRQA
jgi:hypothetical protein